MEERNVPEVRESLPEFLPAPAPIEKEVANPVTGNAKTVTKAGDLMCIAIHEPSCDQCYLPDGDDLAPCGGPKRDQIVMRIVRANSLGVEMKGQAGNPTEEGLWPRPRRHVRERTSGCERFAILA